MRERKRNERNGTMFYMMIILDGYCFEYTGSYEYLQKRGLNFIDTDEVQDIIILPLEGVHYFEIDETVLLFAA